MQGYQQPQMPINYNNPYQQYNNPYQGYNPYPVSDRLTQLTQPYQQPQMQQIPQQQQTNMLLGKIVDSMDVVKASDIPMDNNLYYFPKADGGEIYVKHWLSNGKTEIITYKPFLEDGQKEEETESELKQIHGDLTDKLNMIDDRIAKIEKAINNKPVATVNKNKKEETTV